MIKKILGLLLMSCLFSCGSNGGNDEASASVEMDNFMKTVTVTTEQQNAVVSWGDCGGNTYHMDIIYDNYQNESKDKNLELKSSGSCVIDDIYLSPTTVRITVSAKGVKSKVYTYSVSPAFTTFNVATFNILTANDDPANWIAARQYRVCKIIKDNNFDICGVNEAVSSQLTSFNNILTDYSVYYKNRGDGECVAVLYRKDKFEIVGTPRSFWLSDTPDVMSKGWGGLYYRVCIAVRFKEKSTGKEFYYYVTHLEYRKIDEQCRVNSVDLIFNRMAADVKSGLPIFFVGDMNAQPDYSCIKLIEKSMYFAKTIAYQTSGPNYTYQGFGDSEDWIDYIFVNDKVAVKNFSVISDKPDGQYASDHFPVRATVILR